MILPLLLLAASAQASVQATPNGADPRLLFSYEDYPAQALKNHEQGTVQAELTIGADGRVKACKIIRSSKSEALDTATCNILTVRARFTPARDAYGNPTQDTYVTPPISWRIVEEPTPANDMSQVTPGRYRCTAEAGKYWNEDILPLQVGQEMRVAFRMLKENDHPEWHPAASVILETPEGKAWVTVGKARNDIGHLYVAFQQPGAEHQQGLWQFPLTDNWIIIKLKLDGRGNLALRNNDLELRFKVGKPVSKTTLHCHSGEFEIDVWPRSYVPAPGNAN